MSHRLVVGVRRLGMFERAAAFPRPRGGAETYAHTAYTFGSRRIALPVLLIENPILRTRFNNTETYLRGLPIKPKTNCCAEGA